MDLAQLLAELLRLMAANPPVVTVNGPSEAVQIAQIVAASAGTLAVCVAIVSLIRSGRHHADAIAASEVARHRGVAGQALAETLSALQALYDASNHLEWAEEKYPEVVAEVKAEWARGEKRSPMVQFDLDRINEARDTAREAKATAKHKVTLSQLHLSPGDKPGEATSAAYDAGESWYWDAAARLRDAEKAEGAHADDDEDGPEPPDPAVEGTDAPKPEESEEEKSKRRSALAHSTLLDLREEIATFVQSGRGEAAARARGPFWFGW